jgi:hypothetical protein
MKRNIGLTTLFTLSAFLFIPQVSSNVANIMPAASAQTLTVSGAKCSNDTLKGTYSVSLTGWITNGSVRVPYASVGTFVANGEGFLQGTDTVSLDGVISPRTVTATYTINPDCTGTATSQQAGSFSFAISPDGSKATNISTVSGTTVTGISERLYK